MLPCTFLYINIYAHDPALEFEARFCQSSLNLVRKSAFLQSQLQLFQLSFSTSQLGPRIIYFNVRQFDRLICNVLSSPTFRRSDTI